MIEKEQIEIQLSKTKMMLTFFGSLLFVVLGLWFLINTPKSTHWLFGNPIVIFIAGIASVLFFGLVAVIIFRKFSIVILIQFLSFLHININYYVYHSIPKFFQI
jgi:hypothetical protein